MTKSTVRITWQGSEVAITPDGQIALTESATLEIAKTEGVTIQATEAPVSHPQETVLRCNIPADVADRLSTFAHRTYAPDTPESRIAGAGAGLTDND